MAVEVNTERMGVQIEWDPTGGETTEPPDKPDGIPTHPIFLPPEPTHPIVLPPPSSGGEPSHPIFLPPYVDIGFPEDQPYPDQGLPGDQPEVSHPIAPGGDEGAYPSHPILLPDYNPPSGGNVPTPQHDETLAVQVFAQNMADEEDWSNLPVQKNTGLALISYPKGYKGESWIEVRALDGSLVDCGAITVG